MQQYISVFRKMWKLFLYSALIFCFVTVSGFGLNEMIVGPGKWSLINVKKCDSDDLMPSKLEVTRRKINRTCDGLNGIMRIKEAIDSTFAVLIKICEIVDGGCKPFQQMADKSFEKFVKKYSKENVIQVLKLAGIKPPDFPIFPGTYEVNSFVVNWDNFPEHGRYGTYVADVYILKDGVDQLCINIHCRFRRDGEE